MSCRCIKLQIGGEAAQAEAWEWLAANQLSALVTTKECRWVLVGEEKSRGGSW